MSVEATAAVWAMRGLDGPEKLVAVRLADHADPDGRNAFPSVARLAADTGQSARTVQRTLRSLIAQGVITESTKAGPHGTRRFAVNLGWQSDTPDSQSPPTVSHPDTESGATDSPAGGDSQSTRGCQSDTRTVIGTVKEPSSSSAEKPKKPRGGGSTKLPDPFILNGAMRAWAAEHTPSVDVRAETEKFVDYWRGRGAKRADWVATWRNWMRNAPTFNRTTSGGGRLQPVEKSEQALDRVFAGIANFDPDDETRALS